MLISHCFRYLGPLTFYLHHNNVQLTSLRSTWRLPHCPRKMTRAVHKGTHSIRLTRRSTRLQARNLSCSTTTGGEKRLKERDQRSYGNEGLAEGGPTRSSVICALCSNNKSAACFLSSSRNDLLMVCHVGSNPLI